jgi:hypothetical protein
MFSDACLCGFTWVAIKKHIHPSIITSTINCYIVIFLANKLRISWRGSVNQLQLLTRSFYSVNQVWRTGLFEYGHLHRTHDFGEYITTAIFVLLGNRKHLLSILIWEVNPWLETQRLKWRESKMEVFSEWFAVMHKEHEGVWEANYF